MAHQLLEAQEFLESEDKDFFDESFNNKFHLKTQASRRELQNGNERDWQIRRAVIGLFLLGIGAIIAVSLFQNQNRPTFARPAGRRF